MRHLLFLLLFLTVAPRVKAQKDSINIYLNFQDLWGLDLKSGSFSANFYTMMEQRDGPAPALYYLNGKVDTFYTERTNHYFESWNQGEFRTDINFANYPLDKQNLEIVIEPEWNYDSLILFSHNNENILIGKDHLVGWKINRIRANSSVHTYKYFNSYTHREESRYSRMVFTVEIEREHKWVYFLKLFFPSFISMLILMIGFLIPTENIETRYGLGVASIFGVISSLILIQQNLPEIAGITLIEILNYIAIVTVFATLVIFGLSYGMSKKGKATGKFERNSLIVLLLFYVVTSIGVLLLRS